ncbi:FecR domain-containing protein [Variovorax sp. J22G73]|uniref:FecR domain-containing protein n=1 Tax=unclassified Variovorax TaxID=663243 RepID=UPI002576E1A6|nr:MULTISPECIES: FecR domain-containing protein [unclassified Variovorax]MDM0008259.1 FecR domain-containing protein [Variovorax sp. J22R203]MDM0100765.1 FecR domain-containing protein [Variovorax sp. J22G73]
MNGAMTGEDAPIDHRALREAAEWFAALSMPPVSVSDQHRWRDWLAASRDHQRAWARVEAVDADFAAPRELPDGQRALAGAALKVAAEQVRRRRQVLRMLVLAGAGGALATTAVQQQATRRWLSALGADHRTATGETRRIDLAGGGALWLASATAVDLVDDAALPGAKLLRLLHGEVLVETGHGVGARPLAVQTPHARLQPLGTRFSVRLQDDGAQTLLCVFEGRVSARLARSAGGADQVVPAGMQVALTSDASGVPVPVDPAREAWTRGVLLADGMRLDAVVAELARYRRGRLACSADVGALRVTGGFPLLDTDRALQMLAGALPVRISAALPWWVSVEPR